MGGLLLFLMVGAGVLAARQAGLQAGTPPTVAILLPDQSCTAPCWRGIRAVVTSKEEGAVILNQLPQVEPIQDYAWRFTYQHEEYIAWFLSSLTLLAPHIRLGDILAVMGEPDYQTQQIAVNLTTGDKEKLVYLYYEKQQVIVLVSVPLEGRLSMETPLAAFEYPRNYYARPFYTYEWLGLIWLDKYPPMVEQG